MVPMWRPALAGPMGSRVAVLVAALLLAGVTTARAEQYLGRTVADVRVDVAGVVLADPAVIDLVETRIGEPLTMINIRSTIDHLVGLGRFEDVRVFASPSDQGVIVRWLLTPVRRIGTVEVDGDAQLPDAAIRAELADRFGAQPSVSRVADMVGALEAFYADRGFRRAAILSRLEEDEPQPERVTLVLTVSAGTRVPVRVVTVTTTALVPEAEVLRRLNLQAGRPFDRTALDTRIAGYEEELRGRGYYEARVRQSHDFSADGTGVDVRVEVEVGPHVRVVFAGDPLAGDAETLVPIREERSVDEDLLEDASRRIEDALRREGYRAAQAPYVRRQDGDQVVVTFTVTRGLQHRVGTVDVAGLSGLVRAELAPLLQVRTGEAFVEARVGAVAAAITELYRVRGFTQAAVKPAIQVLPAETRGGASFRPVDVRFDIQEGPQTLVSVVAFEGTNAIRPAQLAARMALAAGRPFYRPRLAADRDALQRVYRSLGYQSVSVISQLAFSNERSRVAITWTVAEGPRILVDRVLIKGNRRTGIDLIRRELTIRSGSPISDDALVESQRQLAATGLFRRVRVSELPRTGSNTRDVLVDLEEAPSTTVSYGGGLEVGRIGARDANGQVGDALDVAPRGFFDISRRNLWGKNRSVTLFARVTLRKNGSAGAGGERTYGFNDYRGLFTFREPRAFGTTGDAQLTAFVEQGLRTSFDFNRRGVTADYAKRFGSFTTTARYTFDYTKLFNEEIAAGDQLLIDRLFPQVKLSKVFASILRDSRDDVLDPHKGAVVGVDASVAAKVMGSEVGFVKTFAQGFIYRRLPGRGFVLAAGARVGVAVGFKQTVPPVDEIAAVARGPVARGTSRAAVFPTVIRELPASERFFAGGDTTVRGFALDRLGTPETLDRQGFPQGGNGLAVFNLEARAPYWNNLQFVWFTDAGNVFKTASDLRLDELRFSSGLGFRYRSPIGPLRVDWGFKLGTRLLLTGGRERSNVLHISLGQAF
ncbi:MAG: outer membrane protein assembly factor [Acidobacteria bacterium]|nr:outer membrane protein assembly factor [Acidobacteriota bacterium]MSO60555.1 outer membrane protein assembly factor [Acidobacteriota bacterium]